MINNFERFWLMERTSLQLLIDRISSSDVPLSSIDYKGVRDETYQASGSESGIYSTTGSIASIPIKGIILKNRSWELDYFGIEHTATLDVCDALSKALADSSIQNIQFNIESPGGTVSGVQELGDAIYNASKIKTTRANVEDMAASAGYWLASQADTVSANESAAVGSIGVYMAVGDFSEYYNEAGVKVHVISNHELKGAGVQGSKITPNQIKNWQREIDSLTSIFVSAVARGRGLSEGQVSKLATGQVWHGQENLDLNLVDEIRGIQQITVAEPSDGQDKESSALAADNINTLQRKKKMTEELLKANQEETAALKATVENLAETVGKLANGLAQTQEANARGVEQSKDNLIAAAQADGRVSPAMLDGVKLTASACGDDLAKFQSYVDSLPKATHENVEGKTDDTNHSDDLGQYVDGPNQNLSAEDRKRYSDAAEIDIVTGKVFDSAGKQVN